MNETPRKPCQKRLSLMVFIFVYPLVTALLYFIAAVTPSWALWQRSLIMVPFVVVCMVYVIIPLIHRRFSRLILIPA